MTNVSPPPSTQMREAEEKRSEMIRLKLLQQYQEAKLKRKNKIKSRKYRKLARKQKEKDRRIEIEELRRTDPEAAARMEEDDGKTRIVERAMLRHRNNSKYMQMQGRRARKDKEVTTRDHENIASLTLVYIELFVGFIVESNARERGLGSPSQPDCQRSSRRRRCGGRGKP